LIELSHWRQIYYELYRASLEQPAWPDIIEIRERASRAGRDGSIPIAFMDLGYSRINPAAFENEPGLMMRAGLPKIGADQILEKRVFAVAPLRDYTYRGADVEFSLEPDLFFTNRPVTPASISIDFDDGRGFLLLEINDRCQVSYAQPGPKCVRVRADFDDGTSLWGGFGFDVRQLQVPAPDDTLAVTASIPYLGEYATGEAYILYGGSHTSLTNPILVIEGFDIDNTMNWEEIYEAMNQESMIETLSTLGYDAVVLNFTDATDYIQRNSFAVVELIDEINSLVPPDVDIAIIGASMGALCGRYALAYMEDQGLDHNTRTFISFDGPHKGANIPLGMQYWIKFFSGQSEDAASMLESLGTPAPRQMLVYYFTDPPGSTGESDSLFGGFLADLAAVGSYPADPRKVAVANGSGYMIDQGFAPGEQIILYEYSSLLVDIIGNVWAVPDSVNHIIFDGLLDLIWPFPDDQLVVYVEGTKPYDSAPGGTRSSMADMDSTEAPYGDVIALHDKHCFIPTVSALDLDTDNLFYDIANDPDILAHTPFDTVYYPVENENHITITAESKEWFLAEIAWGTGAGVDVSIPALRGPMLERNRPNPFHTATTIRFSVPEVQHVEIEIFDVTGRRVARLLNGRPKAGPNQTTWDGKDDLGRPAASGIYFCTLKTPEGTATQPLVLLR
jgi:hypothetical protein